MCTCFHTANDNHITQINDKPNSSIPQYIPKFSLDRISAQAEPPLWDQNNYI